MECLKKIRRWLWKKGETAYNSYKKSDLFISDNFSYCSCSDILNLKLVLKDQGVKKFKIELPFEDGIKKVTFDSEYWSGSRNWRLK